MELKNIKFEINKDANLKEEEKEFLIEAYRKLFIKIYGRDVFDSFASVTKQDSKSILKNNKRVKKFSTNYMMAVDVLGSVQANENFDLLMIFGEDDKLLGAGRLRKINEIEASVPDVAIDGVTLEETRDIWKKTIDFAENHFAEQGFEKMFVEVPLHEAPLLVRADDLGFKEFPENVIMSPEHRTYLLSKTLERKQNVEFNTSRR